ncbi:SPOR domain-containing protein [Novosphingobium sp. YAF33]|uniref:SPOR domain-containing protein n=1 Tax=Novosphingobium sp. YAF33 TaxID=3233082 RepID=UPI003F992217
MRLPVNHALPLAALFLTASLAAPAQGSESAPARITGPAADYPVVVGEPFTIGAVTWTPVDQLNYDAVGYAQVGDGTGVTAAHKTLPLPSYVEVTALGSGRTILVRLERRGPMTNDALLELAPEAAAQLGLASGARSAVRVRRVNPPEVERAALRSGTPVPARMETPEGLLKVLRRKLAEQSPLLPPPSSPPTMPKAPSPEALGPKALTPTEQAAPAAPQVAGAESKLPPRKAAPAPFVAPVPNPKPRPSAPASRPTPAVSAPPAKAVTTTDKPARKGSEVVQVGAFSVEANARKSASQLGASVTKGGKFWRVQMGPFANRAQAAAALEKAKAAGYSDARIQRAD